MSSKNFENTSNSKMISNCLYGAVSGGWDVFWRIFCFDVWGISAFVKIIDQYEFRTRNIEIQKTALNLFFF